MSNDFKMNELIEIQNCDREILCGYETIENGITEVFYFSEIRDFIFKKIESNISQIENQFIHTYLFWNFLNKWTV